MKNILMMLLILELFTSCSKKEKNTDDIQTSIINKNDSIIKQENPYLTNYENKKRMKKLLDSAIIYGDTISYKEAYKDFLVSDHSQEFLYYSIKMAKRNNYNRAYFDTYCILNLLDHKNNYLSQADKNESLFYLLKAYEKGDVNAKYKLDDLYIKKNIKIPSSSSLLNK